MCAVIPLSSNSGIGEGFGTGAIFHMPPRSSGIRRDMLVDQLGNRRKLQFHTDHLIELIMWYV